MSFEKISVNRDIRHWLHTIEQGYRYTAGPIGTKFLEGIKAGKLLAGKCPVCGRLLMPPPKAFCQYDFAEIKELVEIAPVGVVRTYTVVYEDSYGNKLPKPVIIGFIEFPGVTGGLVHYIINVEPGNVKVGLKVRPVFKPENERRGSITDIVGFEPV